MSEVVTQVKSSDSGECVLKWIGASRGRADLMYAKSDVRFYGQALNVYVTVIS